MEHIFYNKKSSVLFVAAMLVLIVLVCMLLTLLTQMAAINQKVEELTALIEQAQNDQDAHRATLDFMQTNEYVIMWAYEHGMVSSEDVTIWIQDYQSNK